MCIIIIVITANELTLTFWRPFYFHSVTEQATRKLSTAGHLKNCTVNIHLPTNSKTHGVSDKLLIIPDKSLGLTGS